MLTTVLFCLSAVSANRAARQVGSIQANWWRLLLSTLLLALWAHGWGGGLDGRALWIFLISGVIGLGIGDVALYQSYPRLGSRLTLLLVHCLAAPMAAVGEWMLLGTLLDLREALCGITILLGVGLALAPAETGHLDRRVLLGGCLWALVAAAGQGLGAVFSRWGYRVNGAHGLELDGITVAYQRIVGGLAVGLLAWLWVCVRKREGRRMTLPAGGWILVTGLSGPTLGVACFQWALMTQPGGIVLAIVATTPLVVIPMTVLAEGDRPGARAYLGGVLAVGGVAGIVLW